MTIQGVLRALLILLSGFLAVTAILGGAALLTGAVAPGTELLGGSVFTSYTIPGLALLVVVGGSALAATTLLLRRHRWAVPVAAASGAAIVVFELVEVLTIGSESGAAWVLQTTYFAVGVAIMALAGALWWLEQRAAASESG